MRLAKALDATDAEIAQLKTARVLTLISRATQTVGSESESVLAKLLTVATGMSAPEISALETIAQVLKSLHVATELGESAM